MSTFLEDITAFLAAALALLACRPGTITSASPGGLDGRHALRIRPTHSTPCFGVADPPVRPNRTGACGALSALAARTRTSLLPIERQRKRVAAMRADWFLLWRRPRFHRCGQIRDSR